jgi:tyrosine-specific transport protein
MKVGQKKYLVASSVLIGSCIGAGVLGIPYVAAQTGFLVALIYILLVGVLILTVNLYLGEVVLRTKGDHQLIGYVEKYLGKKIKHVMEFAVIFGIYAGIVAYMLGMGTSLSYLIFGNSNYEIYFGILVGLGMAYLLRGGMKSLKRFEKYGVLIILSLLLFIIGIFLPEVVLSNLFGFNSLNVFLPFGVVLFALMSFHAIPEIKIILKHNEYRFRNVIITGTIVSVLFYSLFTFVVVGFKGNVTPQVATLALGGIFILLGIFTMFTSYLSSGNALRESFQFDERLTRKKSWFLASIIPIGLFLLTQLTDFFSFTRILSFGGVIAGGTMAILILLMVRKAKVCGDRNPEYTIKAPWIFLAGLILVFLLGVVRELFV